MSACHLHGQHHPECGRLIVLFGLLSILCCLFAYIVFVQKFTCDNFIRYLWVRPECLCVVLSALFLGTCIVPMWMFVCMDTPDCWCVVHSASVLLEKQNWPCWGRCIYLCPSPCRWIWQLQFESAWQFREYWYVYMHVHCTFSQTLFSVISCSYRPGIQVKQLFISGFPHCMVYINTDSLRGRSIYKTHIHLLLNNDHILLISLQDGEQKQQWHFKLTLLKASTFLWMRWSVQTD